MQKLHKINVIVLWVSSIFLIILITLSRGLSPTTIKSDIGMTLGPVLVTILYFTKASDVVKGTGITVIIALTCLLVSMSQGGNDATFIVSFVEMGMALLYFNKKIIISFLSIYIPICIVAAVINPAYIVGPGKTLTLCMENIASFTVVGILMVIATSRGSRLITSSEEMLKKIQEDAVTTNKVIAQLNTSMEESSQSIGSLTQQIQAISDATYEIETLTKTMNSSATSLGSLVSDTVTSLNQNADLNKELEENFTEVGTAVQNGSDGALEVKTTLDAMKDTVLSAGEATKTLLGKISSVSSILKEINKITMRTSMLSINASIEAAKAGDNGKGFSVVAEEIKSLADESSESAKSIQQLISELSKHVDDVASKSSAGSESAIAGMTSIHDLLSILSEIKNANDVVSELVSKETQTNDTVNSKFETVSEEISNLVSSVVSISDTIESVAADIHRQNDSIKVVNEEISKMRAVTMSLDRSAAPA